MTKESCGQLLLVFGGLAFLVYVITMLRYLFPALIYGSHPAAHDEQREKVVDEVRASGVSLATVSCAGRVGGISLRGPLITVDIRPLGIIISPLFGSSAVRVDQIKQLTYEEGFWRRGLRITHTSRAISSPIFLAGIGKDSPFAQTLASIIANLD
jgi:hypothetical protein